METINNFTPRRVYSIDKKTGEAKQVDYISPGRSDWDQYYVDYEVKQVVVPIEGTDDEPGYRLENKVIVHKRSIYEVINSQADEVGLENMIKKFELTGDPSCLPSPVQATDGILDLTKLPSDSADFFKYMHDLEARFNELPLEIRKDLSMADFAASIQNGEGSKLVDDYFDKLKKDYDARINEQKKKVEDDE